MGSIDRFVVGEFEAGYIDRLNDQSTTQRSEDLVGLQIGAMPFLPQGIDPRAGGHTTDSPNSLMVSR
ncbi:hypothetical protein ABZ840_21895 [Streptomyces sp. NPDC047117]|uniref:hypothetical protein n=1 Tax=Streptomyces sp. NPDC047117 TaxID=3155379 RepID=UPI003404DA4C